LEAAGARVGVYRRRDARLEGYLEISRRFPPNVFKWYGATLVIAANYAGRPGQSRGRPPLSFRTIQVCLQDLLAILGQVERAADRPAASMGEGAPMSDVRRREFIELVGGAAAA